MCLVQMGGADLAVDRVFYLDGELGSPDDLIFTTLKTGSNLNLEHKSVYFIQTARPLFSITKFDFSNLKRNMYLPFDGDSNYVKERGSNAIA